MPYFICLGYYKGSFHGLIEKISILEVLKLLSFPRTKFTFIIFTSRLLTYYNNLFTFKTFQLTQLQFLFIQNLI